MPNAPLHNRTPAFTRLQDGTGQLYDRAAHGQLVPDTRTLADYQADFSVEKIGDFQGLTMLWFFPLDK